jgi:asparagine synthase (glutamine-hydrolysing)
MCGIVGLTWNDPELVAAMAERVAHRGPDQSGCYTDALVSLGHRRLSILDLSERGRQPMASADGSIVVVHNGEIYNFLEIRRELEAQGFHFRSNSDTEVIIHAYLRWGIESVKRFNGMFAFALWDARRQELFLVRDRIGIKPLYYSICPGDDRDLIFASELKALLECPRVSREIDPESIYRYIGFEFVPAPETIFAHVRKLPPAHFLHWKRGRPPRLERYWRLKVRSERHSRQEHEQIMRDLLERAVQRQLISDVPLGVFLSGGLDSSAIVSMMSKLGVEPLDTFSLHYEDATFSELDYARYVAEQFKCRHHVIKIDPVTPEMIATCCWHLDEPMTDLSAMPFYLLCQKVRQQVTVCLSGEGGDELLCGYDRFKASKLNRYYSIIPRALRRNVIDRFVDRLSDRPQKKGIVNMLKRFVDGDMLPEEGRHMRWQYFCTPRMQRHLFRNGADRTMSFDPFAPIRALLEGADCEDGIAEEIYVDMCMTMPESLLMKADKMSMAHALEVRVPFLDHEFAEFCCTIPSGMKLQGLTTKTIFRSAMAGILPDHIRMRGKQGYSLPIKNWLRGELRDYMEESFESSEIIGQYFDRGFVRSLIVEHMQMKANHNHVLWALLNLAVWHAVVASRPVSLNRRLHETATGEDYAYRGAALR